EGGVSQRRAFTCNPVAKGPSFPCPHILSLRRSRVRPAAFRNGSSFSPWEDAMAYTLPSLPYAPEALEPHIDKMTMEIHHGRHHKTYVDNLNKALEGQAALANKTIEQLLREINSVPQNVRQVVINN